MDWRESSFSGDSGDCVQVRRDLAAVRDSKNPTGPVLIADLDQLLTAVKTGHLTP
jgi:hypothetical protein